MPTSRPSFIYWSILLNAFCIDYRLSNMKTTLNVTLKPIRIKISFHYLSKPQWPGSYNITTPCNDPTQKMKYRLENTKDRRYLKVLHCTANNLRCEREPFDIAVCVQVSLIILWKFNVIKPGANGDHVSEHCTVPFAMSFLTDVGIVLLHLPLLASIFDKIWYCSPALFLHFFLMGMLVSSELVALAIYLVSQLLKPSLTIKSCMKSSDGCCIKGWFV